MSYRPGDTGAAVNSTVERHVEEVPTKPDSGGVPRIQMVMVTRKACAKMEN